MSVSKSIVVLLILVGSNSSFSQIVNDTVFLEFRNEADLEESSNDTITGFWFRNELYPREMRLYKQTMDEMESSGDSLIPPTPFSTYPLKPVQYYKYFISGKISWDCSCLLKPDNQDEVIIYPREKLKDLDPRKKWIFVIKKKKDSTVCYPVSFYVNAME